MDFKAASDLLPSKIETVFEAPKVNELISAVGFNTVLTQVEFEITKMATIINVGGNINDQQVTFIAEQLIEKFPNESIADFKLCFKRGLTKQYGEIYRMDSIVLFGWMEKYLDEKYELLEAKLMKEKESIYEPIPKAPEGIVSDEKAKEYLNQMLQSVKGLDAKQPAPLTDKDVKLEGKEKPKRIPPKPTPLEYLVDNKMRGEWMRENFDIITGNKVNGWLSYEHWLEQKPESYQKEITKSILK